VRFVRTGRKSEGFGERLQCSDENLSSVDTDGTIGEGIDGLREHLLDFFPARDFGNRAQEGGGPDTVPARNLPPASRGMVLAVGLSAQGDGSAFVSGSEDLLTFGDQNLPPAHHGG